MNARIKPKYRARPTGLFCLTKERLAYFDSRGRLHTPAPRKAVLALCLAVAMAAPLPVALAAEQRGDFSIGISADRMLVAEGENVLISAIVRRPDVSVAEGVRVRARVNGKDWGAEYRTSSNGVAELVLPLPVMGDNAVDVVSESSRSYPLHITVVPSKLSASEDPDHRVIVEYTWPVNPWAKGMPEPILGRYSSLDERVARQHALWFNELGVDAVELDWSNNLRQPFPGTSAKEHIQAADLLFETYAAMRRHPRVVFLVGPEHDIWFTPEDTYAGPNFKQQVDFIYDHYIANPKYRDISLRYEGKPLLLLFLNGPRTGPPPHYEDERFTIRYVSVWNQTTHQNIFGVWSWCDQSPVAVNSGASPEALTVTPASTAGTAEYLDSFLKDENDHYISAKTALQTYGSEDAFYEHFVRHLNQAMPAIEGISGEDYLRSLWQSKSAHHKDGGETLLTQWGTALRYKPRFVILHLWNEYVPEFNQHFEPTAAETLGAEPGFYYFELIKEMIHAYRQAIYMERHLLPAREGGSMGPR